MFDKLVKIMALVGAVCMIGLIIGAASMRIIGDNVEVTGNLKVQGINYAHVPVGTVVAYWGPSVTTPGIPNGWLLCNGQSIAGDQYAALRALCGSTVPNLQGYFLRGLDSTGTVDPDAATRSGGSIIGSTQMDAFQGHGHYVELRIMNITDSGSGTSTPSSTGNFYSWAQTNNTYFDDGHGSPKISSETRPKNVAVNYIIKY